MAFDEAGDDVTKDETSVDYSYSVVPEYLSSLILPAFMIASLLSVIIYKRKRPNYS